jgi:hypothetical protein
MTIMRWDRVYAPVSHLCALPGHVLSVIAIAILLPQRSEECPILWPTRLSAIPKLGGTRHESIMHACGWWCKVTLVLVHACCARSRDCPGSAIAGGLTGINEAKNSPRKQVFMYSKKDSFPRRAKLHVLD